MKSLGVKVTYLYNSGFIVETHGYLFIFDYYRDQEASPIQGKERQNPVGVQQFLGIRKKIMVFVSHRHGDHFNPVIFDWMNLRRDLNYILSNDLKTSGGNLRREQRIKMVGPYEELEIDGVKIKTYGSTDEGVSFLLGTEGLKIFHAGDLNWWYWWDDTEEEQKEAEHCFKTELAKMKGEKIDLAFFPVDPRLKQNFAAGGEYFIKEFQPEVFIPMHFAADYNIINKFIERMKAVSAADRDIDANPNTNIPADTGTKIIRINKSPQQILL